MENPQRWLDTFFQVRGIEKPNGQMLFRYRTSRTEYEQLKALLAARFTILSGAPWRFDSRAECALFVLYASEWWRREYAGGFWRWHDIFQSLTAAPYKVEIIDRSVAVERGLYAWGLRPSADGRKYLGAIVANGGLPLQMVARGDGVLTRLLLSATRKAQLLGWEAVQLVGYFESQADDMVTHLRAPEIYHLLAEMVTTVMALRREYQLSELGNPVAVLDQKEPRWRERFPVLVEDASVEPLLIGMVREVARQAKAAVTYPVVVTRSLVALPNDPESYALQMEVQMPATISRDALASAMGLLPQDVPLSFVLEMAGNSPTSLGQGRQLLGAQDSAVLLTGKPRRFLAKEACQEVLLTLRSMGSQGPAYASVPGGDALDDALPWCFALQSGSLILVGMGSCTVAAPQAHVLLPDGFECSAHEGASVELVGLVEDLPQPRWLYQVRGAVDVLTGEECYSIRTSASNAEDDVLVWKGSRFAGQSASLPVFKGVPRLYRLDIEGQLHPVGSQNIEWTQPVRKGAVVTHIQQHRGPVDAWLLLDGQRQRRFRMVLIGPTAEIAYQSGTDEAEVSIEFQDWGITALHTAAALSPESVVAPKLAKLTMRAQPPPPASTSVTVQWASGSPQLHLQLPFPVRGGRFTRSDGSVLLQGVTIGLQRIHDVRVQVFDQNPNTPKRYKLHMQLLGGEQDGNQQANYPAVEVEVPVLAKQHIGELRFFEIESTLKDLFCQCNQLDSRLEITLLAGSEPVRVLRLTRYDLELEREQQSLAVPGAQLIHMTSEQAEALQLHALPLLELGASALPVEPLRSEGVLAGRWDMAQLPVGHSPWLIYSGQNSSLQVRAMHWLRTPMDLLGTLNAVGAALCPLAQAMSSSAEESRAKALAKVIPAMAEDFVHPSWKLLTQQYQQLKHLPLVALDYWRVIAGDPSACLAAVLKLPGEIPELMPRMRDELGVVWELTSAHCLRKALRKFCSSLEIEMGTVIPTDLLTEIVNSVFTKIGHMTESLALQIDRLLWNELDVRSDRFERMAADYLKTPQALLQALWRGQDSLLQRILLRHHAQQDVWPDFKMLRELLIQIEQSPEPDVVLFFRSLANELIWHPPAPLGAAAISPKQDVANTPLLLGILIQITDATAWLQSNGNLAALRQIKAFDPVWFDVGLQTGALLALKASEKTTP